MPRRKKFPSIQVDYLDGGKNSENHLVQKSNPLLSLSQTDMTLPELKILDIYLFRIDGHDEEKRSVQLEKCVTLRFSFRLLGVFGVFSLD